MIPGRGRKRRRAPRTFCLRAPGTFESERGLENPHPRLGPYSQDRPFQLDEDVFQEPLRPRRRWCLQVLKCTTTTLEDLPSEQDGASDVSNVPTLGSREEGPSRSVRLVRQGRGPKGGSTESTVSVPERYTCVRNTQSPEG